MNDVQIFVEGIADQKFLQDLIAEWYNVSLSIGRFTDNVSKLETGDIFNVGGKGSFNDLGRMRLLNPIIQTLQITETPILIIFDADNYKDDEAALNKLRKTFNFHHFLFPYNGQHPDMERNNGDLETLLQEIICPDNQIIFDCWQAYESCLDGQVTQTTQSGRFTLPARKTKISAYLEALVGKTKQEKAKIKEENRDYRNPKHWNLDPAHPSLKPLKDFLDPFFITQ